MAKQTIGYKYFAALHMILCHGVIDSIRQIVVSENKTLLKGRLTAGTYNISKENIFGGEKSGGGIQGNVDIMDGSYEQDRNPYIVAFEGKRDNPKYVPAYRGVAALFMRGGSADLRNISPTSAKGIIINAIASANSRNGMYLGTSSYLKTFKTMVQRITKKSDGSDQWYLNKAQISTSGIIEPKNFNFYLRSTSNPGQFADGYYDAEDAIYKYEREGNQQSEGSSIIWSSSVWDSEPSSKLTFTIDSVDEDMDEQFIVAYIAIGKNEDEIVNISLPSGVIAGRTFIENNKQFTQILIPVRVGNFIFSFDAVDIESNINIDMTFAEITTQDFFDMNPSHIVRECLTDSKWGLGESDLLIDEPSFIEAADTLYDEGFGLSITWSQEGSIEDFIGEILRHIQGFLYIEPLTGKYKIKLARNDYNEDDILVLDKSNILFVDDYSKSVFSELVNSLTVTYTNIGANTNSTLTVQDIALVTMRGGEIKSESVEYRGITSSATAGRVAMRDLRTLSTPLVSCTIAVKRSIGLSIRQGDVVKVNWSKYHINDLVMRVEGIDYGDSKDNKVVLTVKEDIYSLPETSIITTDDSVMDVDRELKPITKQIAFELPFIELVRLYTQATAENELATTPFVGYLGVAAKKPIDAVTFGTLWEKGDLDQDFEESTDFDFCPVFTVSQPLTHYTNEITITDFSDFNDIEQLPAFAQVDDELISIENIEDVMVGDVNAKKLTLKRGILDTQVKPHSNGLTAYVWDVAMGASSTQYMMGEVVDAKITSATVSESTEVDDAIEMSVQIKARATRPLPPQNVKLNGEYFPSQLAGELVSVTWSHRNRLQQTSDTYIDWFDSDVPPESGTEYTVEVYSGNTLINSVNTTDNFATIDTTGVDFMSTGRILVKSTRDSLDCFQPFEHEYIKISGVAKPINLQVEVI